MSSIIPVLAAAEASSTDTSFAAELPDILKAAASSPLAMLALMTIILGVLAYYFFRNSDAKVKVSMFVLLFVGTLAFGVAAFWHGANKVEEAKAENKNQQDAEQKKQALVQSQQDAQKQAIVTRQVSSPAASSLANLFPGTPPAGSQWVVATDLIKARERSPGKVFVANGLLHTSPTATETAYAELAVPADALFFEAQLRNRANSGGGRYLVTATLDGKPAKLNDTTPTYEFTQRGESLAVKIAVAQGHALTLTVDSLKDASGDDPEWFEARWVKRPLIIKNMPILKVAEPKIK